jgi:hypothetical protein
MMNASASQSPARRDGMPAEPLQDDEAGQGPGGPDARRARLPGLQPRGPAADQTAHEEGLAGASGLAEAGAALARLNLWGADDTLHVDGRRARQPRTSYHEETLPGDWAEKVV